MTAQDYVDSFLKWFACLPDKEQQTIVTAIIMLSNEIEDSIMTGQF